MESRAKSLEMGAIEPIPSARSCHDMREKLGIRLCDRVDLLGHYSKRNFC